MSWSPRRRPTPPAWASLRRKVLERDNHACQLRFPGCLGTATQVDHVMPLARGGTDDEANLQSVCVDCHRLKTLAEQRDGLIRYNQKTKRKPIPHPGKPKNYSQ